MHQEITPWQHRHAMITYWTLSSRESFWNMEHRSEEGKKNPIWINEKFFHGELLLSEALDHSLPPFFAAAHIMVITSLGLLPLFIYLPLQEAVINPRWQTCGVVSSPKTPCLMRYICLINTSLSSAAFLRSDSKRVLWGGKAKAFRDTHEPFGNVSTVHLWMCVDLMSEMGGLLSKIELKSYLPM